MRLFHWFVLEIWLIKRYCNLFDWEYFGSYLKNKIFPKYEICTGTQNIINGFLATCQNLNKNNDTIPRKHLDWKTEGQTEGRMEGQLVIKVMSFLNRSSLLDFNWSFKLDLHRAIYITSKFSFVLVLVRICQDYPTVTMLDIFV